jgi:diamine N-acetyltransferase
MAPVKLSPNAALEPMTPESAQVLGPAVAAIDPWARHQYPASRLSTYLAMMEPDAPRFAIRAGEDLAGAMVVRFNWLRGPYLQFLGILPAYQNRGIGRFAVAWMEAEARARDDKNLWVAASGFNVSAIKFYQREGFKQVADLENLVSAGETELLFRKRL